MDHEARIDLSAPRTAAQSSRIPISRAAFVRDIALKAGLDIRIATTKRDRMNREKAIQLFNEIEALRERDRASGSAARAAEAGTDEIYTQRPLFNVKLNAMTGGNPNDRIFEVLASYAPIPASAGMRDRLGRLFLEVLSKDEWSSLRVNMYSDGDGPYLRIGT